ncbi:putative alpha-1,3-glucanase/mutanase [Xylogone sp. PMI_703]|nr:putative alpha-1,3-glucanase/mutanase [Xylogone sp. PMI_703]
MVKLSGLARFASASWLLLASLTNAIPAPDVAELEDRQAISRMVFCHFMIGIVGERGSAAEFDADMQRAKSLGIDAFALNIGVDGYTDQQLGYAYQSAANNGMKVFISFDFNWYSPTSGATAVGQKIAQYANQPAQLKINGKVFASSFAGDALDVATMRSAAGVPVFWAPNFHPGQADFSKIDGALNWMAWPNNGNNKAPTPGANVTVEAGDNAYLAALGGKPYIAPVSPWFNTHFGPEVSFSKNWVFPSDLLWFNRWNEILTLGPQFIEIITWNDYGESHYIGPLSSPHFDDGNSKWTNDMPHDGWLDMAKPFIAAYHAGATSVNSFITSDELIYWYRPTLRSLNCDATDTTMVPANNASGNYFEGRPNGWEDMQDAVFVVALLTAPGIVTVNSGGNVQSFNAPAGASAFQVNMQVGQQQFSLSRNGQTVLNAVSLKNISPICICGIYNFNAYVGSVPAGPSDPLGHDGLVSLPIGLHVSTCSAVPSLGTAAPPPPPPTTTSPHTTTTTSRGGNPPPTTTTTTARPTTTTTVARPTTTTAAPPPPPPGQVCVAGTGPGNYAGLCNFCCNYGYCPPGPCTCTAFGSQVPPPPTNGRDGAPLPGEDDSYLGLCSFACNHGYCPPTACQYK